MCSASIHDKATARALAKALHCRTSVHRASRLNAAVIRRICLARCCATCICARQEKDVAL